MSVPVYLVKGGDDVLRGDALSKLLDELVGTDDRSLVLDEFDLDVVDLGAALDAAQTIPFLTERRIVVARRAGRFTKGEEVKPIVDYLLDPLPSTTLVLVWEKSVEANARLAKLPPTLTKAVTAAGGEVLDTGAPSGKGLAGWVADQLREAGLDVDGAARGRIVDTLGEDAGSLVGLIKRLQGALPPGTRLGLVDVEPFLGPSGGVPPWELTDAIDTGDVRRSLDLVQRMMAAGDRHPLAIMAPLQSHYTRMLRLDGAGARSEKEAAQVLGLKGSTFPAKKAMTQAKRLGGPGVRRAVGLLATADVDLRGARAWPGELVMEVLVARLARLSRAAR